MAKCQPVVSDEILEIIAETIGEKTAQIDCYHDDVMIEIEEDTPETVPLSARIEERYTSAHLSYYAETVGDT